ncbi:MAG: peptidylprolyl isomerase [Bacteroidota bacterium]|nr:peptidylprolyl isomerase [Candidatus Kapabacteria bacterium]MDW8219802.1 peptidylprolyl isomerase [Bacteroidota bacterium]
MTGNILWLSIPKNFIQYSVLCCIAYACIVVERLDAQQVRSQPEGNTVLARVGKEAITYKMLEDAYRKNINNKSVRLVDVSADSVRDFLNLYINYRLKIHDARARGYDKRPEIVQEIQQNRASLAAPYLFERVLVSPRVDTSLARRRTQFRIGLIFIKILDNDTARAYKRSLAILEALKKGADFRTIAKDSSDDEYFRALGGEMPLLTSDKIVREIEDAVFRTKVGAIYPKPIRSNLTVPGYYIMKLLSIEPRIAVRGRYIVMKLPARTAPNGSPLPPSPEDSLAVFRRADSVRTLILRGLDFAEAAKQFSEDAYAEYGGIFPAYYTETTGYVNGLRYRFPEEVDKWLFAPDRKNGDMSHVISTFNGMYIVRRDSSKIGGDDREELKRFYKRVHFEADKRRFLDSVKKARKYSINIKALNAFLQAVDTTRPSFDSAQKVRLSAQLLKETLAKFTGYMLTINGFADSLLTRSDLRGYSLTRQGMMQAIEKLTDIAITDVLVSTLEKDYPEFAALMKEFEEGILIFRVEEQEIWSKMKFDTARARAYYEPIKERFKTQELYEFAEIWVSSDSLAQALYKRLQAAKNRTVLFDSLATEYTERAGFKERKGKWDPLPAIEYTIPHEFKKRKTAIGDILPPFKFQGGYSIARLDGIQPVRMKTFEEAIPDFAAQFQDMVQKELTQKWLDSLRAQYPVVIEEQVFRTIWK